MSLRIVIVGAGQVGYNLSKSLDIDFKSLEIIPQDAIEIIKKIAKN